MTQRLPQPLRLVMAGITVAAVGLLLLRAGSSTEDGRSVVIASVAASDAGTMQPPAAGRDNDRFPASEAGAPVARQAGVAFTPAPSQADPVEARLAQMSLDEKLGQMLMFGFAGQSVAPALREQIVTDHIGNIVLLPLNAGRSEQVRALTAAYQELVRQANGGIGALIGADQEGGSRVTLAAGYRALPRNADVGATGSAAYAAEVADGIARDLRDAGITMTFGPVLDVNDNPANPVIAWRSYSPDPAVVSELGAAAIRAYRSAGVIPTAKHFPGHGNTDEDSHITRPVVSRPRTELERIELAPFRRAVAERVEAIMTAHVIYTALDAERPATLSPVVLTRLLREEMDYTGVIITDDFTMEGVLRGYGAGPAAVLAVQAGADIVMVVAPESRQREVHAALRAAVADGTLSVERIDASVHRVLRLKQQYRLLD